MAFADIRQDIINGIDSAQSEAGGWDAQVKAKLVVADVVRDSSTQVTVTLSAGIDYNTTADEVITVTVPASALTGGVPIVATPTLPVYADLGGGAADDRWRACRSRLVAYTSTRIRRCTEAWAPSTGILNPALDAQADNVSRMV